MFVIVGTLHNTGACPTAFDLYCLKAKKLEKIIQVALLSFCQTKAEDDPKIFVSHGGCWPYSVVTFSGYATQHPHV